MLLAVIMVANALSIKRNFLKCENFQEYQSLYCRKTYHRPYLFLCHGHKRWESRENTWVPVWSSGWRCSHPPSICSLLREILLWGLPKSHRDFSRAAAKPSPLKQAHDEKRNLYTILFFFSIPILYFPASWLNEHKVDPSKAADPLLHCLSVQHLQYISP